MDVTKAALAKNQAAKARAKNTEINIVSQIIGGRNQTFLGPADHFDPQSPLRGKKRFNENFRPLRSKINL